MDYEGDPKKGVPIHYEEIIVQDGYVTGVARLKSPSGAGDFEIRVSGQRPSIDEYEQQARVIKLDIAPIAAEQQFAEARRQQVLLARRQEWLDNLNQLKAAVESAGLDELKDAGGLYSQLQPAGKDAGHKNSEEDLSRDRLIEITPVGDLGSDQAYHLSFVIDPTVPQGRRDIYKPVVQGSTFASAAISVSAGDADLELYRGGGFRDASRSTGASDSVFGSGGVGGWKLHVIGFTNATYQVFGDWVLRKNNA